MSEERATLLIVEDDQDVADMLSAYFNVQGYSTLTANWGEDAVKICVSEFPDLLILDIHLPDIDGFEVAHRLRNNRLTRDIPILFLIENLTGENRLRK
ncbi:MAG: response regulator, partial [Anaerolineaceae bacterium]|nr:response regulator [Anaerolineaceae bacterium]